MGSIHILKVRPSHLPLLQHLFVTSIQQTCAQDYTQKQIEVWTSSIHNIDKWLQKIENQFFIAAWEDEQIMGFASLENGNYLDFMYVHPNHQQKGVAQRLFNQLQEQALNHGSTQLFSDVSKTALPFFKKQGFHTIKENIFEIHGVEINNFRMCKVIKT